MTCQIEDNLAINVPRGIVEDYDGFIIPHHCRLKNHLSVNVNHIGRFRMNGSHCQKGNQNADYR